VSKDKITTDLKILKDRLQEVPKGDNWSRRHFSFPGDLRDISVFGQYKKGYKNPISNGTTGFFLVSSSPCMNPMQLFSSLLYK
jgi:hypothetical protein